jgi:hypothetical protein
MQILRKENGALHLTVWSVLGLVNPSELKVLFQIVRADELCHPGSAQLIDLRAITIDGPTPEFSELFTTARLLWRDGPGDRWALLTASPLIFGLLRMIHALLSDSEQSHVGLHREFADASQWLLGKVIVDPAQPTPGWSWSHA